MNSNLLNSNFRLRVKTGSGKQHLLENEVSGDSTLKDLKTAIYKTTSLQNNQQKLLIGFPPKPILYTPETSLSNIGIKNGEVIIVETCDDSSEFEKMDYIPPSFNDAYTSKNKNQNSPLHTKQDNRDRNLPDSKNKSSLINKSAWTAGANLEKMAVPSDNSCLFTSIFYLVNDGNVEVRPSHIQELRSNVAAVITSDPETYCDAILEKSNADYCSWILKDTSWGGAIEVMVLSNWYSLEIVSLDVTNLVVSRFGEDQHYRERIILLYDGIHYDPVQLRDVRGRITTKFSTKDDKIIELAKEMMVKAKNAGQFTDTAKFKLVCGDCDTFLRGEAETVQHAKATGHTNFRERS